MKLWREIVSAAIVGTERQRFELSADVDNRLSRVLRSLKSDNNETALLRSAAITGVYLKNGVNSAADKEDSPVAAPDEKLAFISRQSEQYLATMLAGNHPKILSEFFDLAAEKKRVLPPEFLAEALDLGSSKRDLRKFILPVLGARGRWLARYNNDWRWALIEENAVEIWENGSRDERLLAIEVLRRQNPAEIRELLSRDWQSESAKDRAAFLEVLRINLNKSDESFLDKILQTDKSIDVRRVAFDLLLGITDSNPVEIITQRAAALFNFKTGGFLSRPKIEINFPENFEKEAKDDVLNNLELYPGEKDLGKKAVKIVKLLGSVPPKIWEEKFSTKKEIIIEAAKQSDWQTALLSGWKSAAVNFADREWLISILTNNGQNDYYLLCGQIERRWTGLQIERLIALLLEGKMKSGITPEFAAQLLYRLKNIWSDDFTLGVLNFLKKSESESDSQPWSGFITQILNSGQFIAGKYLKQFEEKASSGLFEKIVKVPEREKLIEEFIAVIQFRREMHTAFQSEEQL